MCVMMKLWSLFIFMLLATPVATLCCMHLSPGYVSYVAEACDSGLVGCSISQCCLHIEIRNTHLSMLTSLSE